jgi:hypothetical protein
MSKAPMTASEISGLLAGLLSAVSGGSAQVQIDSAPFATLDAESRDLAVQIGPFLNESRRKHSGVLHESPIGLWNGRSIPSELARRGWRVTVCDGPDELMALGRGTSALLGHVHVSSTGLWKLRKLL